VNHCFPELHDLFISPVYVTSVENKVDALSHGCLGPASSHLQNKINLPPCLIPFLCGTYLFYTQYLEYVLTSFAIATHTSCAFETCSPSCKAQRLNQTESSSPLVPVAERFIHWLTPFGLYYMDHLSKPVTVTCSQLYNTQQFCVTKLWTG